MFVILSVTLVAFLLVAAIYDYRTLEVPIPLSVSTIVIVIVELTAGVFFEKLPFHDALMHVVVAVCISILLIILMIFGNLGGADMFFGTAFGLVLGLFGFAALLNSFLLPLPYLILREDKNKEYPFVPFMLVGYILTLLMICLGYGGFPNVI